MAHDSDYEYISYTTPLLVSSMQYQIIRVFLSILPLLAITVSGLIPRDGDCTCGKFSDCSTKCGPYYATIDWKCSYNVPNAIGLCVPQMGMSQVLTYSNSKMFTELKPLAVPARPIILILRKFRYSVQIAPGPMTIAAPTRRKPGSAPMQHVYNFNVRCEWLGLVGLGHRSAGGV